MLYACSIYTVYMLNIKVTCMYAVYMQHVCGMYAVCMEHVCCMHAAYILYTCLISRYSNMYACIHCFKYTEAKKRLILIPEVDFLFITV